MLVHLDLEDDLRYFSDYVLFDMQHRLSKTKTNVAKNGCHIHSFAIILQNGKAM